MSCKDIYVRVNGATAAGQAFYTMVDEFGGNVFASMSHSQLASGLTFSIAATHSTARITRADKINPIPTPCEVVQNGLTLYWDAGISRSYSGSGTSVTDLSTNSKNGTLVNGVGFTSSNFGAWIFDGSNDHATVGSSVIPNKNSPYTVSVWCYRNRNNAREELVSQWTFAQSGNSFFFGFDFVSSQNRIRFGDEFFITSTETASTNTWLNVVGVYTVTNAFIYVNASLKGTKGSGFLYTGVQNFVVGRQGELNDEYFSGRIANILCYNRALSSTEILRNYDTQRFRFGL